MTGSLVDMFPPEMQTIYGAAAGLAAVTGLVIWAAGIKIARASLATLMGIIVAGVCAWSLPGPAHIAPLTAAIIGFVAGVLAGAVTFRFLQGILVAACVALVAGGIYYRLQVVRPVGAAAAATMSAQEMLIPVNRLGDAAGSVGGQAAKGGTFDLVNIMARVQGAALNVDRAVLRWWNGIDMSHQQRIMLVAGGAALAVLLLSIFFPRHTTWIVSAALGTLILLVAGFAIMQVFVPQYQIYVPSAPMTRWAIVVIVMLLGMLTQRRLFWSAPKPAPKVDPAQAAQR